MKKCCAFFLLMFITIVTTKNFAADRITVSHGFLPKKIYSDKPLLSPNGKLFAIIGYNKVTIWDMQGRQLGTFIDPKPYINPPNNFKFWNPNRYITGIGFLPDNRHLAIAVFQRTVHIVDLSGTIVKTITVPRKKMGAASGGWSYITKIIYFPDGKRLITYEPGEIDIVIRDPNFRMIKRISMKYGSWGFGFPAIRIAPSGKYFVTLQDMATPSTDGWNSIMKLFTRNGKFVRDLETDRPGRVTTVDGRFKKEFIKPKTFHFSPDGKDIVFTQNYFSTTRLDPMGRTFDLKGRKKELKIIHKIRRTNIFTGKQTETWITNQQNIGISEVAFTRNGKAFLALDSQHVYTISFKGKIISSVTNEKMEYKSGRNTYNYSFSADRFAISRDTQRIVAFSSSPAKGIIIYDLMGKKKHFLQSDNLVPENIYCSHYGKYLSFEFERAKKSYLFNANKNSITTEQATVCFDKKNRVYSLGQTYNKKLRRKMSTITFNGKKRDFPPNEFRLYNLILFPNNRFADTYNGFTLFTAQGDAIRRYPAANIGPDTAVHPDLKYYISPSTSAKYKTVQVYNLQGKKIREWYLGAFFTFTYALSPDTTRVAAGHDKAGYVQVWDNKGKLLHRFSDLHAGPVNGVAMTKNNRFLLSSEDDGTIMITNLKNNQRLMLSLYPDGRFIASDSLGRFDCSPDLKNRITISKNGLPLSGKDTERYKSKGLVRMFLEK